MDGFVLKEVDMTQRRMKKCLESGLSFDRSYSCSSTSSTTIAVITNLEQGRLVAPVVTSLSHMHWGSQGPFLAIKHPGSSRGLRFIQGRFRVDPNEK